MRFIILLFFLASCSSTRCITKKELAEVGMTESLRVNGNVNQRTNQLYSQGELNRIKERIVSIPYAAPFVNTPFYLVVYSPYEWIFYEQNGQLKKLVVADKKNHGYLQIHWLILNLFRIRLLVRQIFF